LPQFMPSSIRQYAVDFNGDGKIDLRNEPVDAIGSVAHFLSVHGWRRGLPLAMPVQAPADAAAAQSWQPMLDKGLEATYSLDDIKAAGIVPNAPAVDSSDVKYGLVDLQNGNGPTEYWLGSDNFFAVTKYNRSYFYAMSVIDLGRAIRAARGQ
jgi:membrane-bound lytic murein transglycosylase B